MNPLYQQMKPDNGMLQRFLQFKNTFRGNPQEQVQQVLNSGRVSQAQYDNAVRMANQLKQMMGM